MTVNPIETLLFTPHPRSKRAEVSLPFFALFDGLAEGGGGGPFTEGKQRGGGRGIGGLIRGGGGGGGGGTFTEEKHSGGDRVIRGLIRGGKHVLEQRYFFRRTKSTKMKQRIAVKRRDL